MQIVHTFATMKAAGIGIVEMRRLAAAAWQEFQNDVAMEENTKPVVVTAKTARHHDFAAFAIFEDGELSDIVMAVVEDDGDFHCELAHHVMPDFDC